MKLSFSSRDLLGYLRKYTCSRIFRLATREEKLDRRALTQFQLIFETFNPGGDDDGSGKGYFAARA